LKHFPSLRRWAISDDDRQMELDADLLTEAKEAAGVVVGAVVAGDVVARPVKHDEDRAGWDNATS
jgi:hypothetical protein